MGAHSHDESYAPRLGEDLSQLPLFRAVREPGPFDRSNHPRSPQEELIGEAIWKHKGRDRPVPLAQLVELAGVGERTVKGIVESLRDRHRMPIGARREEPFGYFVIVDADDLEIAVQPYRNQILSMWRVFARLAPPSMRKELHGQLRLEEQDGARCESDL
jgi:hypothetical protein